MKKIFLYILSFSTIILFGLSCYQWLTPPEIEKTGINIREKYDPNLRNIKSLKSLESFHRKIAIEKGYIQNNSIVDSAGFVYTLDSILQYRFYSDRAEYSLQNNYISAFLGNLFMINLKSTLLPQDIIQFNGALCNQQAILFQDYLRKANYNTRRVGFFKEGMSGHYVSEVRFDGKYHYFDSNLEATFDDYKNIPSALEIIQDSTLLTKAYEDFPIGTSIIAHLKNLDFDIGPTNKKLAIKGQIFHTITKFFSNTLFLFTGIFALFLYKQN